MRSAPLGVLVVVATPIGNLEDITLRALRTLRQCDVVVAEDTRRTRALLTAHNITRPLLSLPAFDEHRRVSRVLARLAAGDTVALCTDAGTPAVSDPGARLVAAARAAGYAVRPLPGASALTAALSAAGVAADAFCFLGFLPRSPSRLRRAVEQPLELHHTVAFFESPLRLSRTLRLLTDTLGDRQVVVAREVTKVHETFHTGTAAQLAAEFAMSPPKGECTVLVAP